MTEKNSNARHVREYRRRMRRAGLRLVQFWVPDTRAAGFEEECRRQSLIASEATRLEGEISNWLDSSRDTEDWTR